MHRTPQCKGNSAPWFVQYVENILTFVLAKHSQFIVLWCSIWQLWDIIMCAPHWPTPNTCLVNLPIERSVGYRVGPVTQKWFSCQMNQPLEEDVSYRLGWLSVTICTLVPSKVPFSDPPFHAEHDFDHKTAADWSQFCPRQCQTSFWFVLYSCFYCWMAGDGKVVEI